MADDAVNASMNTTIKPTLFSSYLGKSCLFLWWMSPLTPQDTKAACVRWDRVAMARRCAVDDMFLTQTVAGNKYGCSEQGSSFLGRRIKERFNVFKDQATLFTHLQRTTSS